MLKLLGFASSNYYNAVKLALLEKAIPFTEERVYTGERPDYLTLSPMGKVPCLQTDAGPLIETRAILEYLEERYPDRPLLPKAPYERALVRRTMQFMELYLELEARKLLGHFFARKEPHEKVAKPVRAALDKAAKQLPKLLSFSAPYLGGEDFGMLDLWSVVHLPAVTTIAQKTLGYDPLAGVPHLGDYLARISQRPHVAQVQADRDADFAPFAAHLKQHYGL